MTDGRILLALEECGDGLTVREICDTLGIGATHCRATLNCMREEQRAHIDRYDINQTPVWMHGQGEDCPPPDEETRNQ